MSISFNSKLNRAGLSGSFGSKKTGSKTSGISAQAVKNLGSSSATSKTTLYSLSGRKNRNFVGGQHVTKGSNKFNYQNARASLNSRHYSPSNKYSSSVFASAYANYGTQASSSSAANFFNSLNMGMQIGQQVYSLLNNLGIINTSSSSTVSSTSSGSSQLTDAMNSLSGNSLISTGGSEVSSLISSMESAKNSTTLRGLLSNAHSQYSSMSNQISVYNANNVESTAKQAVETAETDCDKYESEQTQAKNNCGIAQQNIKATTAQRDNALNAVTKADSEYGATVQQYAQAHDKAVSAKNNYDNASKAYDRATSALTNAKNTLASTPKTLTDTNGNQVENPAYKTAEQAVKNAEVQKQQAETAKNQAETQKDTAEQEKTKANEAKEAAYKNLGDSKDAVDNAEQKYKDAQEKLDTSKEVLSNAEDQFAQASENLEKANATLDANESIVEQCKTLSDNAKKLNKSIEKQSKRLEELEEKEEDEYDKYDTKAQKGIDKNDRKLATIDGDVDTLKEKITVNQANKRNSAVAESIEKRNQYTNLVNETECIKTALQGKADMVVNGDRYHKITTPSGATLYYRNGQMISEEEYESVSKANN